MDNLGIFFINLEARVDKKASAIEQLSQCGIPFERVRAVTDNDLATSDIEYRYFRLISAVKRSHLKACLSFLSSNYDFALILEDDFTLDPVHLASELNRCISSMNENGLHFLQVGYLGFDQIETRSYFEKKARYLFEQAYLAYSHLRSFRSNIIVGRIRWGAQAYLIDRKGAENLIKLIDVTSRLPYDAELRRLARVSKSDCNHILAGRLKKNLIQQVLTYRSDIQGVV